MVVWFGSPTQTFLGFCEMEAVGRIEMKNCSDRGRPGGKTPIKFSIGDLLSAVETTPRN